jgi:hypothetical protein
VGGCAMWPRPPPSFPRSVGYAMWAAGLSPTASICLCGVCNSASAAAGCLPSPRACAELILLNFAVLYRVTLGGPGASHGG